MKLLLVEDNPADARLIREMLKESPRAFQVEQAPRLDAALEWLRREPFDLVLLDLGLPDSQGTTTIERVHEASPDMAIVVLTGLNDQEVALEAIGAGAQDYLVKGRFDAELFARTVRYATDRMRAQTALRAERKRLLDVLETLPAMVCLLTPDHHVAFANRGFRQRFGESSGRHCYEYCFGRAEPCDFCETYRVLETGQPHDWEIAFPDGTVLAAHDFPFADADGSPLILEMDLDISGIKRAQAALKSANETLEQRVAERTAQLQAANTQLRREAVEREIEARFLLLINRSGGMRELAKAATEFFREQSGCEAVGLRLKHGEDFPYYETRGFPPELVQAESSLCCRDGEDRLQRDEVGNPVLAGMCGVVLGGRGDPTKPFHTTAGSFWVNSTTDLRTASTEADRRGPPRDRCNGEGYESLALVALRAGSGSLGLLQLADRRPGRFTPEALALWERLAGYLAVAVARARAEEALRAGNEELERFNRAMVGRELRMIELKEEVNALCAAARQPPRYGQAAKGEAAPPRPNASTEGAVGEAPGGAAKAGAPLEIRARRDRPRTGA